MSINNFIPSVWSAKILAALPKMSAFTMVANRDYEGEIKDMGNVVKINSISDPTIKTYTKNTNIDAAETLSDAQKELAIDQGKYFNFQVDDVDKVQQQPKVVDEATIRAAAGLADAADVYMAGLYSGASSGNIIGSTGTPETISAAADMYNYLVDLGVVLSDNKVPKVGRWITLPPWAHGLLLKDDRFVKAGTETNVNMLFSGVVGYAAGFAIYESGNLKIGSTSNYTVQAGYAGTLSYAEQIIQTEAYRPEARFADAIKGLHIYGAKLVRPDTMAVLIVTKPS